jgi:hypothetical protein
MDMSGTIASKLPKDVCIDQVTAGNILDRLRQTRKHISESFVVFEQRHAALEEIDAEIRALADALTVTKLRSGS